MIFSREIFALKYVLPAIFFQVFSVYFVARHEFLDKSPEPCRMIFFFNVTEFVYYHVFKLFRRSHHKLEIDPEDVISRTAPSTPVLIFDFKLRRS